MLNYRRLCGWSALVFMATPVQSANVEVRVGGGQNVYVPARVTITLGDTVTFYNAGGLHNVVAEDGSFRCANGCDRAGGSGTPSSAAWRATVLPTEAGTIDYYCQVHGMPVGGYGGGVPMRGSIVVQPPDTPVVLDAAYSGNWYDPAQNGHGIQLEYLGNNVVTAFWFTFDNAGNQVWLNGAGTADGHRVQISTARVIGGRFPPNFNPALVQSTSWGTLTLTFASCQSARLDWTTTDPAFTPSGFMNLTRLTQVSGTSCP
ncbi:cupredoxin domain-containing protein [Tahibacter amnicola]|uniref:Blue (type 1) copper domain-containing protein n=1 Tax=Tahibacter amnicola TaxID=2976241 RepID=A0ABY6BB10_9GAMM|nr:plastocyanin/azurin family copper-binding protein [Tahibacter amnicola]UXI66727.1 hypothetical protein N4264_18500 [Tahibacter amnicola]